MATLTVSDLMTEKVYTIKENEDLQRLYELMDDIRIRHVPVVDDDKNVIGIVSHRDLVHEALYVENEITMSQKKEFLESRQVSEIMVPDPETVSPDQSLNEAGRIMLENKISCLPVTEGEKLVGILTEADFVKYVVNNL